MFTTLAAAAITLSTALSPMAAVDNGSYFTDPPDDKIVINIVTVNGSGCPAGTASVAMSPDNTAFTVTYSSYLARSGGNSLPTDFRKNCQLAVVAHVPGGFSFAIYKTDYRGFAHLEKGATASHEASYYFQGMSETPHTKATFNGPYDDNWQTTTEVETPQLVYSPCGEERIFNINTELRANAGTLYPDRTSFVAMDSTDADLNTTYHVKWKDCTRP